MSPNSGQFKKGHKSLLTEISKKKISDFQKGRVKSLETRNKLSKAHMGKKLTPEHISNLKMPRPNSGQYKRKSGSGANNWRGGVSQPYKVKNAPRPKPEQCEVCGAFGKDFKRGLCYDHDHTTGKFRGWLCMRCNCALGLVKDNAEILESLAKYIRENK